LTINFNEEVQVKLTETAAMGWMMLTMVETIGASEGGIGVMLQNLQKHQSLSEIVAVQMCIMFMGLCQDGGFAGLKYMMFPYTRKRN
jgi:ABC-type nitrate/sulfonate/bicarbonate transport system permease component